MNSRRPGMALVVGLLVALVNLFAVAQPVAAHTRTAETTNMASSVVRDTTPEGITFTVYTGGFLVGLQNATDADVIVAGYDGEPYLRIGPDGVYENRYSPATYLNREQYGDVAVPPSVDPHREPEWIRVSSRAAWVWHDHRTHWMSPQPPRFVETSVVTRLMMNARLVGPIGQAGTDQDAFQTWHVPLVHDGREHVVTGELSWVDPPAAWPWYLAASLFIVLMLAAGIALEQRKSHVARGRPNADAVALVPDGSAQQAPRLSWAKPTRAWLNPLANVVVAVAVINAIHLIDDVAAWPSDLLDELFGLLHTTIFLVAGAVGAFWARYASGGRVLALGIASGALLYHQGFVHLPMLYAAHFPTLWPAELIRFSIALGLLQAAPVAWFVASQLRDARANSDRDVVGTPSV